MIAQLRGKIVAIGPNAAILDVSGVGYQVSISGKTQSSIALLEGEITLLTEMVVREDSMTLFGFLDGGERDAFNLLTTVQGVGAKAAMAILSVLSPAELSTAIISGDKAMVTRADGIGPKIAQRVVNELSEKIGKLSGLGGGMVIGGAGGEATAGTGGSDADTSGIIGDAISALTNLGYGRAEAHTALMRARANGVADELSPLIAAALREMGQ